MATAHEWQARVARWKSSGLTAKQFSAKHALSSKDLYNWASRLGMTSGQKPQQQAAPAASPVRLLRLVPQNKGATASRTGAGAVGSSGVRLMVAGAAIALDTTFDEATLRRVLAVVNSMPEAGR